MLQSIYKYCAVGLVNTAIHWIVFAALFYAGSDQAWANLTAFCVAVTFSFFAKEGANKQVISSQADSLIKISRFWADFFPANTSNQPI
ncbi:GtrA family protein [Escherichia coli]|nr:GtrA family protein [Escherichia coli]